MAKRFFVFLCIAFSMCSFAEICKGNAAAKMTSYANAKHPLFDAYVEYLAEGQDGKQLIDTGIYHHKIDKVKAKVHAGFNRRHFEQFYSATNWVYVTDFQRYASSTNLFYVGHLLYGQVLCRNVDSTVPLDIESWSDDTGSAPGTVYATINGTTYSNGYGWNAPQISDSTIKLFTDVAPKNRIYYFQIENCIDLVPVKFTNEKGQREGAMYDKISGQLFRNIGTGKFEIGPDL